MFSEPEMQVTTKWVSVESSFHPVPACGSWETVWQFQRQPAKSKFCSWFTRRSLRSDFRGTWLALWGSWDCFKQEPCLWGCLHGFPILYLYISTDVAKLHKSAISTDRWVCQRQPLQEWEAQSNMNLLSTLWALISGCLSCVGSSVSHYIPSSVSPSFGNQDHCWRDKGDICLKSVDYCRGLSSLIIWCPPTYQAFSNDPPSCSGPTVWQGSWTGWYIMWGLPGSQHNIFLYVPVQS